MFHIGQMVVCVDGQPTWCDGPKGFVVQDLLTTGRIYTVRGVGDFDFGPTTGTIPVLWLEEVLRSYDEKRADVPFGACRFRPVKQTSIETFTAILNRAPQKVDA